MGPIAKPKIYPFYNSTYNICHVSPLYHASGSPLEEQSLRVNAKRLKDNLKGDTLRGVEVGFSTSYPESLQECTWSLLGDETQWTSANSTQSDASNPTVTAENARGIQIELKYEKAVHSAMLLRDPQVQESRDPNFTSLPLLMLRMPAAVKEVVLDFLATSFDCYIAPLKLESEFLTSALEGFISSLERHDSDWTAYNYRPSLQEILKNLQIQIQFPVAAPSLKNLDITIASEEVPLFLEQGKILLAQQTQQVQPGRKGSLGPFTTALSTYLDRHCAFSLSHPEVRISKVVCGAFALSSDSKVKLFTPTQIELEEDQNTPEISQNPVQKAMDGLFAALVAKARPDSEKVDMLHDSGIEEALQSEMVHQDVVDLVGRAKSPMKRAIRAEVSTTSDVPDSPPPPYELHDSINNSSFLV
ncbi:MAG: hypothetical protein M1820_004590 [Bogoriella megaspora]|nr:MAG: hypothetical protein M1820_004590 [Bogoriella megaspora]